MSEEGMACGSVSSGQAPASRDLRSAAKRVYVAASKAGPRMLPAEQQELSAALNALDLALAFAPPKESARYILVDGEQYCHIDDCVSNASFSHQDTLRLRQIAKLEKEIARLKALEAARNAPSASEDAWDVLANAQAAASGEYSCVLLQQQVFELRRRVALLELKAARTQEDTQQAEPATKGVNNG